MAKITLKDVHVDELLPFLKEINVPASQSLVITSQGIRSRAYPKSKEFIKNAFLETENIWDGGDKIVEPLILPLLKLDKLIDALSFFKLGKVTIKMNTSDGYIASLVISNGVHTFTNKSDDASIVAPALPDNIWDSLSSEDDSVFLKLHLTNHDILDIIKLNTIADNKNGNSVIIMTEKGLVFTNDSPILENGSGNKWEFLVPESNIVKNDLQVDSPIIMTPKNLGYIDTHNEDIVLTMKPLSGNEDKAVMHYKGSDNSSVILVAMRNL